MLDFSYSLTAPCILSFLIKGADVGNKLIKHERACSYLALIMRVMNLFSSWSSIKMTKLEMVLG